MSFNVKRKRYDIAIIGGGLAGLTAALHLSQNSYRVIVLEKNNYPHHKVCGEYVSNEVLPYLKSLGIDPFKKKAKKINQLLITNHKGKRVEVKLPLGGFGISRYTLDHYIYEKVKSRAEIVHETVTNILCQQDYTTIKTLSKKKIEATYIIGAFGKRSQLDKALKRKFIQKKTPWMAVKGHFKYSFPENLVALHHFEGGYCGFSKVETNHLNFCYLVNNHIFSKFKNIEDFQGKWMRKNPALDSFFNNAQPVFEKPLTISQISFDRKKPVENHIFMIGDSASLIHPLCGNGMAMAIKSAKILSETFIDNKNASQTTLENIYTSKWKKEFTNRLRAGSTLQKLVLNPKLLSLGISLGNYNQQWIRYAISKTHGKPF